MPIARPGVGRPDAPIMIVGEAWGEYEERANVPFVGPSGMELDRMLHDAGIMRSECYVTNVINARPPRNRLDDWIPTAKSRILPNMVLVRGKYVSPIVADGYATLQKELTLVKPRLVIALGNTAMWALTGRGGIVKWRGSLLNLDQHPHRAPVVPTYHPAAVLRQWNWRHIAVADLRRARRQIDSPDRPPDYNFIIRPDFATAKATLEWLIKRVEEGELWCEFDVETISGYIRCFTLSWSETRAICIPLMKDPYNGHYWSLVEEATLLHLTYRLMTHPNFRCRGQNLLYDFQYTYHDWHFIPRLGQDTMISHHVLWAGLPKSLAFQASMYADYYWYWKDLGKESGKDGE